MDPILETDRLFLREMSLDDLDFVAAMLGDADVMRFYPQPYSRDDAKRWIERQIERYANDGYGLWLVVEKATHEPVGQVGLTNQNVDGRPEPEIGYLIHKPFWRVGFAREAAAGVRDYAFTALAKPRVISLIRPINIPSQRTALAIGMKPEKMTMHANMEHLVFARKRETS